MADLTPLPEAGRLLRMAAHDDPENSSVKPSIESLEGKLTLAFTLLTGLGAALGTVAASYPDNPHVKVACLVISAVLAALGTVVTVNFTNKRSALKATVADGAANIRAGVALVEKAAEVAKTNPDLGARLMESILRPVEPSK